MLKNIQSCPPPSGRGTSEAKLTEQSISVLHKGPEMWAMDSASLYSRESIITEDPTKDRERKDRGGWGVGVGGLRAGSRESVLMRSALQAFAMLSKWGDVGGLGLPSEVVEANQHFGRSFMSFQHEYLPRLESLGFFVFFSLPQAAACVWSQEIPVKRDSRCTSWTSFTFKRQRVYQDFRQRRI